MKRYRARYAFFVGLRDLTYSQSVRVRGRQKVGSVITLVVFLVVVGALRYIRH